MPVQPKVTKSASPHHWAPRQGEVFPHSGIAPWAHYAMPAFGLRG